MHRPFFRVVFTIAVSFALSACGFSPSTASSKHSAKAPASPKNSHRQSPQPKSLVPWGATAASSILPGDILIADSHNNRILLVTPQKKIVWQYPKPGQPSLLHDDDDVFFGPHFDEIITNQEGYNVISIINFKTRQIVWNYGHAGVPGSLPGYLNTPDDAFLYAKPTGDVITVADIRNQRILFISRKTHQILKQYGQTGVMAVNPPATYSAPNGDFPAPNGGMLVTQINGNDAILLNRHNQVRYTVHFPSFLSYPSDANFTPHGNIIVAFYTNPGAVVEMSPTGKVLWLYRPLSGPGRLDRPSLAVKLPNGLVLLNDDYNDRVIVINPKTNQIVWQYGHTGIPGTAPGYLNIPDGLDLLPPGIVPGGHNPIGHHLWSYPHNGY
ncbi:hypothetical protein [Sulfobacillus thermosulfidooxidans]|uniref:hypothetical protein n=1 Tax=Sulfobacillus thermosulfidooxidans TaxID=28034 RepID=UPI00096B71EF|nr:hypothetical protein [Sulfobacillus thermosulfidooxidans]OLZ10349.1 hypothetical protein BFX05_10165 [Sulfobacillus thermosulfidooxidans]OLZ17394.1 hypothetical protein BFX06_13440 [Sulfobacillus thermosulfidooxidans]OLZ21096.1 hypothetical protein BFX07_13855 [Sulfobacillus thermosulfidooxidans]